MSDKSNIVMVTWDSVRADHMPFHGYERNTTPFLSKLTEEGLCFENAQVPAVGTVASFTGMFSGAHASGVMTNPDPAHWAEANSQRTMISEILQDNDYYTGGFHYNALMSENFGWGDGWDVYEDHMWDEKGGQSPTEDGDPDLRTEVYNYLQKYDMANFAVHFKKMIMGETPVTWEQMYDDIEEFVSTAPEPFFLWVLLIDTHHPYYPPQKYQQWNQSGIRGTYAMNYAMRRHKDRVGERQQSVINSYDNTIRYADEFLSRLFDSCTEQARDPIFVINSDHGDEFGEHGNYGHRPLMYNTLTRVPLVIYGADSVPDVDTDRPVSLLDLGNTILELAEIDERVGEGISLFDEERDVAVTRNLLGEELGRTVGVTGDEWKVLYHPSGEWGHGNDYQEDQYEAYHIPTDPLEKTDRWGDHPDFLEKRLREEIDKAVTVAGGSSELDSETEERLKELGYI